jgi:streptomycin 6-kinase
MLEHFNKFIGFQVEIETDCDVFSGSLSDVFEVTDGENCTLINFVFETCSDQDDRILGKTIIAWSDGYRISQI